MTLKVRPNTEKPEEKRPILVLESSDSEVTELERGYYSRDDYAGAPFFYRQNEDGYNFSLPWNAVISWCYESDLIEYMKSAIDGGAFE